MREGTRRSADDAHVVLRDGLDRLRGEVRDCQSAHEQLAQDLGGSLQEPRMRLPSRHRVGTRRTPGELLLKLFRHLARA